MTTPLAATGYYSEAPERVRRSSEPSLDPSLLQDLAEALDFLHRQVDDTESELERSREQSLAFEQDARRWQDEAARLREEAQQTRHSLDALRQEFEQTREGSARQGETVDHIAAELAELRAARAHVENLAAEQQRALVLSLELLKRVDGDARAAITNDEKSDPEVLAGKDRQIHELTQLVRAAGEEGTRIDNELAAARAEISTRDSEWATINAELVSDLGTARAELEAARGELASVAVRAPLEDQSGELARVRAELEVREAQSVSTDLRVEEITSELAAARTQIATQQGELEARATQCETAQSQADQLATKLAAARLDATAKQSELESVTSELSGLQARLEASQSNDHRVELEAARLEIAAGQLELDSVRSELTRLRALLETAGQAEDDRRELAAAGLLVAATQSELESAKAELMTLKAQKVGDATRESLGRDESVELKRKLRDAEAEIAIQNTEVESRGAIITALENALEEQTSALRGLEERFLAYAEQVQALQLQRMEVPNDSNQGLAAAIGRLFSPSKRKTRDEISPR